MERAGGGGQGHGLGGRPGEGRPGPAALFLLGRHMFEQEFYEESRDLLYRAARHDARPVADRRQARMLLGIIQKYDNKNAEAEKVLKEALAIQPPTSTTPRCSTSWAARTCRGTPGGRAPRHAEDRAGHPQSPMASKAREQLQLRAKKHRIAIASGLRPPTGRGVNSPRGEFRENILIDQIHAIGEVGLLTASKNLRSNRVTSSGASSSARAHARHHHLACSRYGGHEPVRVSQRDPRVLLTPDHEGRGTDTAEA